MAYTRRVQYYETDKMGIVHHSNYIRWFEEARTEYMREKGINYNSLELNEGIMMPVIAVDCKYKQGAVYGELVDIETSITYFNGVKLIFSYSVYNRDKALLVSGSSAHCFVDMSFKPVRIRKNHIDLYNKLAILVKE